MKWRNLDPADNYKNLLSHYDIKNMKKYAPKLHLNIQAESIVKRWIFGEEWMISNNWKELSYF